MLLLFSLIFGAILASFCLCMIYRFQMGQSAYERSACDHCSQPLAARDLVPIFSWISLRGKCRYCELPLHKRYIIWEVGLALIFAYLSYQIGLSIALLLVLLGGIAYTDAKLGVIPNVFLIPCAGLALFSATWQSATIALGLLILGNFLRHVFQRPGLGWGDVKFLGMAGLWLSFNQLPLFLILTGLGGIFMAAFLKKREIPLGPSLCFSLGICVLLGRQFNLVEHLSGILPFLT